MSLKKKQRDLVAKMPFLHLNIIKGDESKSSQTSRFLLLSVSVDSFFFFKRSLILTICEGLNKSILPLIWLISKVSKCHFHDDG